MSDSVPQIKKSDQFIPYYFVLFFVVLAIVDGIFVTIALNTHTGVVSKRAYEEGLTYNNVLDASKSQEALGWQSSLQLEKDTSTLTFSLLDSQNTALSDISVKAVIKRPIQEGLKFEVTLQYDHASHSYVSPISFPTYGEWEVRVYALQDDKTYQTSKRFVVTP